MAILATIPEQEFTRELLDVAFNENPNARHYFIDVRRPYPNESEIHVKNRHGEWFTLTIMQRS